MHDLLSVLSWALEFPFSIVCSANKPGKFPGYKTFLANNLSIYLLISNSYDSSKYTLSMIISFFMSTVLCNQIGTIAGVIALTWNPNTKYVKSKYCRIFVMMILRCKMYVRVTFKLNSMN